MRRLIGTAVVLLLLAAPAFAQKGHGDEHQGQMHSVGGGYVPSHGPAPSHTPPKTMEQVKVNKGHDEHVMHNWSDENGHPNAPHVHQPMGQAGHEQWVGYSTFREETRLHLDRPWEHGRFPGRFGRSYVYRIGGGGPRRFWFGGWAFAIFEPEWGYCDGWLWDSDDIVLYEDPGDPGWYLAYNVRLGTYVHVMYMGPM